MYTGSLPSASIYGTWSENVEIWSVDDDTLMDLSSVTEATLLLRDPVTGVDELTLTMSDGDIVSPSDGILQWRVEQPAMATLNSKTYMVIMTLEDADDTVPIIQGSISIVG